MHRRPGAASLSGTCGALAGVGSGVRLSSSLCVAHHLLLLCGFGIWPVFAGGPKLPISKQRSAARKCAGCVCCQGLKSNSGPLRARTALSGAAWPGVIPETPQKPPAPACEPARECALFGPGSARKGQASAFALHFHVRVF